MTKQFRNIFLALIVTVNFSSCSYRYFYSQRIDVYAFDSSGQTKGVFEPGFDLLSMHLGIAHSFSNHLFLETGGQVGSTIFKLEPWNYKNNKQNDLIGRSNAYTVNGAVGFFKKNINGTQLQIEPGFIYEKCWGVAGNYVQDWYYSSEYYFDGKQFNIDYFIPNIQSSISLKGKKSEWYFAGRVSCLITDSISKKFTPDYVIFDKVFYQRNLIFEPGIQFSDARSSKSKRLRFYLSGHVCLKKTNDFTFTTPIQGGIKFMF